MQSRHQMTAAHLAARWAVKKAMEQKLIYKFI
jgi:hypothetical protein